MDNCTLISVIFDGAQEVTDVSVNCIVRFQNEGTSLLIDFLYCSKDDLLMQDFFIIKSCSLDVEKAQEMMNFREKGVAIELGGCCIFDSDKLFSIYTKVISEAYRLSHNQMTV